VGVYDHHPENAREFANEYGVYAFESLESLLEAAEAVDILSPVGTHYKYASAAIMQSRNVLLNGILSEDIKEAKLLNELAIEANVNLKILHEEKLHPELRAYRKLVKKPYHVECRRFKNKVLSISNDSMVFGMLLHDIDMLIHLIGSNVRKVHANAAPLFTGFTDFLNVRLEFDNGCTAMLHCGNFNFQTENEIVAYQRNEIVTINLDNFQIKKMSRTEDGEFQTSSVNGGKRVTQDVIRLELEQFGKTILSRQKMNQEAFQSYQSLRIAYQVLEKLHPSNLFNA
jgi:predicted dehydrogenase